MALQSFVLEARNGVLPNLKLVAALTASVNDPELEGIILRPATERCISGLGTILRIVAAKYREIVDPSARAVCFRKAGVV